MGAPVRAWCARPRTISWATVATFGSAVTRRKAFSSGGIISGSAVQPLPFQKILHPIGYSDDSGTGPYMLELQSAGGDSLFVRNFDAHHPGCSGYCQHGYEFFHETVPYTNPAIAKIVFRHGVDLLGTVHVSPHARTVSVVSPNGGEAWG